MSEVRVFKAIVLGDTQVGKSCFMMCITNEKKETKPTIGVEMKIKSITKDDKVYKVTIYDTAGQERFRTVTSNYYRASHLVFLVYDVTSRKSFESVKSWLLDFHTYSNSDTCPPYITLVGNKMDLRDQRVVSREEGEILKTELELDAFYECSVSTNNGVNDAFLNAVLCFAERESKERDHGSSSTNINLSKTQPQTPNQHDSKKCQCVV